MEQTGADAGTARAASPFNTTPSEFAAIGKKRVDETVAMQTELFEKLQEIYRSWFERLQSEAALASEFTARLTAARSLPETATVCQDWTKRRMEMSAEDAKRLMTDGQKFLQTGTQIFSNSWLANGGSGST